MSIDNNSVKQRVPGVTAFLWLITVSLAVAALYTGCARNPDALRPQPVINATAVISENGFVGPEAGPIPVKSAPQKSVDSATPNPNAEIEVEDAQEEEEDVKIVAHISGSLPHDFGVASLEERIVWSDVVARVSLLSVSAAVDSVAYLPDDSSVTVHATVLEFRFRVLEYLKGTGANEIVAIVLGDQRSDTEEEVRAVLPTVTAERETRWDDREAIVFLEDSYEVLPSTSQQGRFYLGDISYPLPGWDGYTVASRSYKHWLPAAASEGAAGSSGGDQQLFLMDAPSDDPGDGASGASGSSSAPTISLGALKKRVSELNAEVALGDGSDEYMRCVHSKYSTERLLRKRLESMGTVTVSVDRYMESGLPAGSVVHVDRMGLGHPPDNTGKYWIEGPDKDLFGNETFNLIPSDRDGDGVQETLFYSRRLLAARPLPAGVYKMYPNFLWPHQVICNGVTDLERTANETVVHVTAPGAVIHETFFDPVDIGSAVGADGTSGVLKPAGLSVGETATTMSGLKWENGAVTLSMDPYVSLAGHALDFIALDGTVLLHLNVSDATADTAKNTLTWPVATQPWQDGDLLMLRLYSVTDSTCTDPAAPYGACPLVFSQDSYDFSVAEDAAAGGHTPGSVSVGGASGVAYSITSGNDDGKFAIFRTTGLLILSEPLDYESVSSYTLTVEARRGGDPVSATVEITVTDVNEPPVFESETYSFSVAENASTWTEVGQIVATDPDAGDTSGGTVFYYITTGNGAGKFNMSTGKDGGFLLVWGSLDYETESSYTLTVEARDGKEGGVGSATVEISVTDVP